ncbi:uncharacterized protein [Penaeus vannamei]|uniref:uncharacterized protein n=1 Tax=Penaeus vannamei TaxID=6689 RepID=UPI00387F5192
MHDAAQKAIGACLRVRQNFISQETLVATDACHAACLTRDRDFHLSQVHRTRSLYQRDKEQFIMCLAEEVTVSGQIVSDPVARPEQSGFTPGKSTIDHRLALRFTVDRRCEFGRGLLAAYIDLKKVFNSVHQESLKEILRLRGIPTRIIGLIVSLYTSTESAVKCVVALDAFSNEAKPKTKIQDFGEPVQSVHACGEDIEVTESFTYLGSIKLRIFKALIMPVLLYGGETWTLSCALESRLDAFCNMSLCQIMGYYWRDRVSNQRLQRETSTGPITCIIRDRQIRLYGHLARFHKDDLAHQVVSVRDNPGWTKPVGRPRKS